MGLFIICQSKNLHFFSQFLINQEDYTLRGLYFENCCARTQAWRIESIMSIYERWVKLCGLNFNYLHSSPYAHLHTMFLTNIGYPTQCMHFESL